MLDFLLPIPCAGCGRDTGARAPLCTTCRAGLRRAPRVAPPAGVDAWVAPFAYDGASRELVARVKYRNIRAVLPWIARAIVVALDADVDVRGSVVTWAPTTSERRRARGFDPAERLARAVARELGCPVKRLLRRAPGPPQTGLPAAARRTGPRFTLVSSARAPAVVLLVDDVATTGATLAAAASTLRSAGARQVMAATAARTPRPGSG